MLSFPLEVLTFAYLTLKIVHVILRIYVTLSRR
jgi:hypothetical protein